jgi:cytochrome c-type biogenesis protein CcmH
VSGRLFAVVVAAALSLVLAAPAMASEQRPTLAELESETVCPVCGSTVDQSNAPIADRMRAFMRERIAAGDTKSEIKAALVAQFGQRVLAAPPKEGFNLLAWVLPFVGLVGGAIVLGAVAWRWARRDRRPTEAQPDLSVNGQRPLEPELERRLDDALARFD